MLKILIVDDEKILRHGIVHTFDWETLGISSVLEARNGKEALGLFKDERPEIIVTDIRMPLMDGIAFAAAVKEIDNTVQIIYITGFSDVAYLKAALKNEALDYILKPIDADELKSAIMKAVNRCREKEKRARIMLEMEQKLIQSTPLLIRQMLQNVIKSHYPSENYIREKMKFLNVSFSIDDSFAIVVISAESDSVVKNSMEDDMFVFSVENIVNEIINNYFPGYVFKYGGNHFVCVISASAQDKERLLDMLRETDDMLKQYMKTENLIILGPFIDGLLNIQESYEYAKHILKQRFDGRLSGIILYGQTLPEVSGEYQITQDFIKSICCRLYTSDIKTLQEELGNKLDEIASQMPDAEHLQGYCLVIMTGIISGICTERIDKVDIDFFVRYAMDLQQGCGIQKIKYVMYSFLADLKLFLLKNYTSRQSQIIDEIKSLMENNLDKNLTIKDISHQVFLTPTYICALFKQGTGKTMNEYHTEIKIQKACKMLITGEYKVYEVCSNLGYQDVKYFSKIFKRLIGITPTEYIIKVRGEL